MISAEVFKMVETNLYKYSYVEFDHMNNSVKSETYIGEDCIRIIKGSEQTGEEEDYSVNGKGEKISWTYCDNHDWVDVYDIK